MKSRINVPEYDVSEFNKLIKEVVDSNFNFVRIKGEISSIRPNKNNHLFITLKDENSVLECVIWNSKINYMDINPEEGLEVIATGKISTWSKYRTTYQLEIDKIEIAGEGALLKLIEERKKRLQKKGYFDDIKKSSLPYLPTRIGIITSPTGSVVHDIINRVNDRFPMPLDIWPVSVQGKEAVSSISNAIIGFNQMLTEKPDVIIIARGGGSTEDLMAFNDESLAIKVFESKIPIVSAIGHETDTTIIDLVADLRASTPTAAAEKTVPVKFEIEEKIKNLNFQLENKLIFKLESIRDNFEYLNKLLKAPNFIINLYNEKINESLKKLHFSIKNKLNIFNINLINTSKLIRSPDSIIKMKKNHIIEISKYIEKNLNEKFNSNNYDLKSKIRLLKSNSISKNLEKGYAILTDKNKIIKSVKNINKENNIKAKLLDGSLDLSIKKIN